MKPIDRLKQLAYKDAREKYPSIPDHALSIHAYSDKTANGLTRCIVDYITFIGGFATRQQSTGTFRQEKIETRTGFITKGRWTKGTVRKGVADISSIYQGRSIQIEVKVGKDKMSAEQKKVQSEVIAAGGHYFVATTFDQFYIWFNDLFNIKTIIYITKPQKNEHRN